jgi:outer membrane beta-barrel protein
MHWTALVVTLGFAQAALAADAKPSGVESALRAGDEGEQRLPVIQNRKFTLDHEFALIGGVYPVDPYSKGITASLGYTVHFSENWAWEVAQFTYSFNFDTDLKKRLAQVAAARNGASLTLPEMSWVVASHLVLKPLYGKEDLFNTKVVHLEAQLQFGPAFVSRTTTDNPLSMGLDFGAGLRFWMTPVWSLRLDLGELLFLEDATSKMRLRQALHLGAGIAANLGGD